MLASTQMPPPCLVQLTQPGATPAILLRCCPPVAANSCHLLAGQRAALAALQPALRGIKQHRLPSGRCRFSHVTAAAAEASSSGSGEVKAENPAILATLFGGWYLANIFFNIYNKQVLKVFASPLTLTTFQFMVGAALVLTFWATGIVKRPKITFTTLWTILPLAVVHTLGNLLTNVSLGAVAVSFTHTIKAMEPFFSVLLSAVFLGEKPSGLVLLTLLPIVGGVACASLTEASFNWLGFGAAMGSNLTFQSRNVLSKKLMIKKGAMDNIALFSIITLLSCAILVPFSMLTEGWTLTPHHLTAMGVSNPMATLQKAVLAGICFHAYQQVSYMILQRVSPVSHSIGNSVKRVVVIIGSVIVFQNPMSQQNAIGTALALFGVFAYSQVKRLGGKAKTA